MIPDVLATLDTGQRDALNAAMTDVLMAPDADAAEEATLELGYALGLIMVRLLKLESWH